MPIKQLAGKKFGRLLVISYSYTNRKREAVWNCECECGIFCRISGVNLISGNTKSCGCLNKELVSLPLGEASKNRLLHRYKLNADKKGIKFSLTKEQFEKITSSNCYYCGRKPAQFIRERNFNGGYYYNGIDRVDSGKGYEIKNVVPCCEDCNYAKRKMSYQSFREWVRRISRNMSLLDRFGGLHANRNSS